MSSITGFFPAPRRFALVLAPLLALSLLAVSCGGGGYGSSPTTPPMGSTVTVQVIDFAFNPKDVKVQPGDTVKWVMMGPAPLHTVTAADGSFDSGNSLNAKGVTFSHTFNQGGVTIKYYCKIHQACCQMQGSVQVGDNAPPPDPGY